MISHSFFAQSQIYSNVSIHLLVMIVSHTPELFDGCMNVGWFPLHCMDVTSPPAQGCFFPWQLHKSSYNPRECVVHIFLDISSSAP